MLRHEFMHMRFCAHKVNMNVKSGLEVTNDSIDKIRIAVMFVGYPSEATTIQEMC